MKIYQSKYDWWLMLIVYGAMVLPIALGIIDGEYLMSFLLLIITVLVTVLFYYTRYKIDEGKLIVMWTKIDVHNIRKIYKTRNPISSPALSLDRIAICYGKFDEILVSPKNREEFIKELLKINPDIEVRI